MEVNSQSILRSLSPLAGFCCELCRGPVVDTGICAECLSDLPRVTAACEYCGRPLAAAGVCGDCINHRPDVDRTVCAFHYHYPVSQLIKKIKYKQRLISLKPLVAVLAEKLLQTGPAQAELLIPVPLAWRRQAARGMNQAAEICKALGEVLDIPSDHQSLRRTRHTRPMHLLDIGRRKLNVRGAFTWTGPEVIDTVAIVDDIITTGATCNEISSLLKASGIRRVEAWSLARASRR